MTNPRQINASDINTIVPIRVLASSGQAISLTGTTVETTLASVVVPGGSLGANGRLRITTLWSYPNSANSKTLKTKFGATTFFSVAQSTTATDRHQTEIANRGVTNSQVGAGLTAAFGTSGSAAVTASLDTTQDQTLAITGQLANAGETLTLETYMVEIIVP
jgi:hypothetical protein